MFSFYFHNLLLNGWAGIVTTSLWLASIFTASLSYYHLAKTIPLTLWADKQLTADSWEPAGLVPWPSFVVLCCPVPLACVAACTCRQHVWLEWPCNLTPQWYINKPQALALIGWWMWSSLPEVVFLRRVWFSVWCRHRIDTCRFHSMLILKIQSRAGFVLCRWKVLLHYSWGRPGLLE